MSPRRIDLVRSFFDRAENHRAAKHVTRLRSHVVRQLVGDVTGLTVLDVGAGDGAVTLDLATGAASLTWLDASAEMLAAAKATVPPQLQSRIRVVHGDLATFTGSFDVVVCVGVLAHVEDIGASIAKLAAATRPGGRLVLELTDHAKLTALPARLAHLVRERVSPHYGYRLNATRLDEIDALATTHGLHRKGERRYWSAPPIMRRLASPITQAAFERATLESRALSRFGDAVFALYEKRT